MRLERYVSQSVQRSRKVSRAHIAAGEVTVNGMVVRDPGHQVVLKSDKIELKGQKIDGPGGYRLVMMNKPAGVITATKSAEHDTVMDHVPTGLWHPKLFPIGRLDKDTTGLLLLTTDGGLSQLLLHPRRHVEKAYVATIKEPLDDGVEAIFKRGVPLTDGTVCLPAKLERIDPLTVRVIVTEGRYHQVKRMLGHVGGHVTGLHRERMGPLLLDPALKPGQARELTATERDTLVASVGNRRAINQSRRPAPRTDHSGKGASRTARPGGAKPGGAKPGGAKPGGAKPGGAKNAPTPRKRGQRRPK